MKHTSEARSWQDLLSGAPAAPNLDAAEVAAEATAARRLVVLDDDPTGTQTVADIPIITSWATF